MHNRHTEKITAGLKRVRKVVGDILIYTPSLPILKKRAFAFFNRCRQHGVTFMQTKSRLLLLKLISWILRVKNWHLD